MEKRKRKKYAKQTAPESFIPEMSGEQWEKDGRFNRRKSGTESLWNEVQYKHKRQ